MPTVFTVEGDLDAASVEELRPEIERLATVDDEVHADLSRVEFIDSSGIGALVFLHKRLLSAGHRLRVMGLRGQPLELLTYLRLADQLA